MLTRAVDDQRRLLELGHSLSFSVNLSGCLVDDEDFAKTILKIAGRAVGKIILEVTETAIIGNPEVAHQTLRGFKAAGIEISIDDYGSGLSSLSYLKNIPADELKVDKIFVLNLATDVGAHELYSRIAMAARAVCPDANIRDLGAFSSSKMCQSEAIARAVQDVRNPRLAAGYSARTNRG